MVILLNYVFILFLVMWKKLTQNYKKNTVKYCEILQVLNYTNELHVFDGLSQRSHKINLDIIRIQSEFIVLNMKCSLSLELFKLSCTRL